MHPLFVYVFSFYLVKYFFDSYFNIFLIRCNFLINVFSYFLVILLHYQVIEYFLYIRLEIVNFHYLNMKQFFRNFHYNFWIYNYSSFLTHLEEKNIFLVLINSLHFFSFLYLYFPPEVKNFNV